MTASVTTVTLGIVFVGNVEGRLQKLYEVYK